MEYKNLEKAAELIAALFINEEVGLEAGKNRSLYEAYNSNSEVGDIVDIMLKKMNLKLYEHDYSLFLTAGIHNKVFGYSNEELKRIMGLRLNRELYLSYYIMFCIMSHFYNDSAAYTYAEYIKTEQVTEAVDASLKKIINNIGVVVQNELEENSFEVLAAAWDEMPVSASEDTLGVRAARGSKTGFVKLVFNFLISQGLFMEAEERYYPTGRFHALIRNYFEEERARMYEIINVLEEKSNKEE